MLDRKNATLATARKAQLDLVHALRAEAKRLSSMADDVAAAEDLGSLDIAAEVDLNSVGDDLGKTVVALLNALDASGLPLR